MKYRLSAQNPAYGNAMQLAQILSSHGIKVKCMLPSKVAQFFVGQKGAALFRTDHGDFEALFASRPEDFAALDVVERRLATGYKYEVYGSPETRTLESTRPMYFLKRGETLLIAFDPATAATLRSIAASQ